MLGLLASPFTWFLAGGVAHAAPAPRLTPFFASAPSPVQSVRVHWSDRTEGHATATISWRAPLSNGGASITSYDVWTESRHCAPPDVTVTVISCSINRLIAGRTYVFDIYATNAAGSSHRFVTSTIGAEGQRIDFPPIANTDFNHSPITLTATATSGLPIHYEAAGACTTKDGLLTLTAVGSCAVTAFQEGSHQFQSAAPVATFFEISPGPVTITDVGGTFAGDGVAHPATITDEPPATGLFTRYCLSTGAAPICSQSPPIAPGVYHVTTSLHNLNYTAKDATTTITINAPTAVLPSDLIGGTPPPGSGSTHFSKFGVEVHSNGSGFPTGDHVDVGAVSEESLGSFTIPSGSNSAAWLQLLHCSSLSTSVISVRTVHAKSPEALSIGGSVAFPQGGFNGAGYYELIEMQSGGFIPHSTVSSVLHSSPTVLSQSVADANGVVTMIIPVSQSLAGQSHQMFLAGTYLVTTTTAGPDGTAPADVTVSKTLLSRLVPGASMVMVFKDAANPSITFASGVTLPTKEAYAAYVKATTPLNLKRYKPVNHADSTMKAVTGSAAALSAVAAGVAAARAAGAASAASHASSISARGAAAAHRGSTETVEAVHHTHDRNREHVGDRTIMWKFPGRKFVDDLSLLVPVTLSRYSPLAAVSVADAAYWRAMFGSLSLVLPVLGMVLGTESAMQTSGYPLPPHLPLFLAITILGIYDATAGFAASVVSLLSAVVTGHAFSLNMIISGLLLATLWFGLPVMVKKVRPFVRPHPRTFQDWWVRIADFFVGPAFAGFLAAKLTDSFSLVSNLQVGLVDHANEVGYIVAFAMFLRYLLATFAVFFFPRRLAEVTPTELPEQSHGYLVLSILVRMGFATLILVALVGTRWFVGPLVALAGLGMYVRSSDVHLTAPDWLYRIVPRNVGKILVFEVVGTVVTGLASTHIPSPYWQIAALLCTIFVLGLLIDLLSSVRGRDWPVNWWTRLAGVGLFLVTVAQLSDNLIK